MKKIDIGKIIKLLEKYKYVFVVIVVGFFLLLLPQEKREQETVKRDDAEFSVEAFEKRVERALSECSGVGRCKVLLSCESGTENVYAKESRKSARENESGVKLENTSDTKPSILSEGSGRESALLVKEIYPSFRGAVVICDGAERADVRQEVMMAVMVLCGLGADKISIIKMND